MPWNVVVHITAQFHPIREHRHAKALRYWMDFGRIETSVIRGVVLLKNHLPVGIRYHNVGIRHRSVGENVDRHPFTSALCPCTHRPYSCDQKKGGGDSRSEPEMVH